MATNVTSLKPLRLFSAGALNGCAVVGNPHIVPELPSSRD